MVFTIHIIYDINTRYLEGMGDGIEGSFTWSQTEAKERFLILCAYRPGNRTENLKFPKTQGFFALAKKNWELALRLFEYQDFTEAPFYAGCTDQDYL